MVTSWKQKEVWRTQLSPALLFSLFILVFCQAQICTMGFGILLTSMPEDIALPWHWITTLPLLAMQPPSQGSTLGTATILEVGCFRQMQDRFSWCRSSGAHHWCLPKCTLLQLRANVFRPPVELQCIQHCGKIEESWSTLTERERAEALTQLKKWTTCSSSQWVPTSSWQNTQKLHSCISHKCFF